VWDVRTLKCVKTLEGHEDNVRVLAVGETCMFSGSWDKTIRVWDLRTLECIKVLEGHTEAVLALAGGRALCAGVSGWSSFYGQQWVQLGQGGAWRDTQRRCWHWQVVSAVYMCWCLVAALASCGQQWVQLAWRGRAVQACGLYLRNTCRLGATNDDVCTMLTGSCTC
jgi:hypothetical protein